MIYNTIGIFFKLFIADANIDTDTSRSLQDVEIFTRSMQNGIIAIGVILIFIILCFMICILTIQFISNPDKYQNKYFQSLLSLLDKLKERNLRKKREQLNINKLNYIAVMGDNTLKRIYNIIDIEKSDIIQGKYVLVNDEIFAFINFENIINNPQNSREKYYKHLKEEFNNFDETKENDIQYLNQYYNKDKLSHVVKFVINNNNKPINEEQKVIIDKCKIPTLNKREIKKLIKFSNTLKNEIKRNENEKETVSIFNEYKQVDTEQINYNKNIDNAINDIKKILNK